MRTLALAGVAVVAWVLVPSVPAAEAETVKLVYRMPARSPVTYEIVNEEKSLHASLDGKMRRNTTRNVKTVTQEFRPQGEDLMVSMKVEDSRVTLDDKPLPADFGGGRFMAVRTPRGEFRSATGTADPSLNRLNLIFPPHALSVGRTWIVTDPATEEMPVPIETTYTLTDVRDQEGRRCAIIDGETKVEKELPGPGLVVKIAGRSKVLFDVSQGILVRSKSRTRFSLECNKQNSLNLKKLIRDISITVRQQP